LLVGGVLMLVKPAVVVVGIGLLSSIRKELKERTKKKNR
jgi:hypothetical protein